MRWTRGAERYAEWIRWGSLAVLVVCAMILARQLLVESAVQQLERWSEELGVWGPVLFGVAYVAAVVLLIPAWVLTLAAGGLFGLVQGFVVVSLASTTGAAAAFLIARYLARDRITRKLRDYPKFEAIDRALAENGWKIVALLRLSPAVPFNLQNYLYGLTGIRFWPCILASWVAMLPGTLLYIYLGYLGRVSLDAAAGTQGGQERSPAQWGLLLVGLLATAAACLYVSRLARRAMRQATELEGSARPSEEERGQLEATDESAKRGVPIGTMLLAIAAMAGIALVAWTWFRP